MLVLTPWSNHATLLSSIGPGPFLNTQIFIHICMMVIERIQNYLRETLAEMKKVSWPSKEQTKNYSLLVIALSLGMAAFLGFVDYILNIGLETLIR